MERAEELEENIREETKDQETKKRQPDSRNIFGNRLRTLREQFHYTQGRLAEELYVSRQAVSGWETGKVQPDSVKLKEISRLFGVSVEYLLGKEDNSDFLSEKAKETEETTLEIEEKTKEKSLETKEEPVKIWDDKERLKKILLTYLIIIVGIPATMIAPLGIIFCIFAFVMSRRWKINSLWLDFVLSVYLAVSVYRIYILTADWIFDSRAMFQFRW